MKKIKSVFKAVVICLMCTVLLVGGGYFYLEKSFKQVSSNSEKTPYYSAKPDNVGVLVIVGNEKFYAYLDFFDEKLYVALDFDTIENDELYGYKVDYKIIGNENFIEEVVDKSGGVELNTDDGVLNFTGNQLDDLLKRTNSKELRVTIVNHFLKKIADKSLDKSLIFTVKKNCETNLKISECYFWYKYLPQICRDVTFID